MICREARPATSGKPHSLHKPALTDLECIGHATCGPSVWSECLGDDLACLEFRKQVDVVAALYAAT